MGTWLDIDGLNLAIFHPILDGIGNEIGAIVTADASKRNAHGDGRSELCEKTTDQSKPIVGNCRQRRISRPIWSFCRSNE